MTRNLALFLSLSLTVPASAGLYNITNRNDSGPGSLRQGILDANSGACPSPCRISFQENLPSTIDLQSPLPPLTASNVQMSPRDNPYYGRVDIVIRGQAAGPGADGFRIQRAGNININTLRFEGFSGNGFRITESSDVVVSCDATNNGDNGVAIVQSERVHVLGGFIAGNRANGVYVTTSNDVEISGALIGGDFDRGIGNGANGIHLQDVKRAQGAFNIIRNNAHTGLLTTGSCERVDFEYNRYLSNGLLGIDHGGDGVTADDVPVIESLTYNRGFVRARGRVRSQPDAHIRLLFYLVKEADPSGYGEGFDVAHQFGSFDAMHVRADAAGVATFEFFFPGEGFSALRGQTLTATATRVIDERSGYGQTSEFARNVTVVDDEVSFVVTNTADSGGGSLRSAIEQANDSDCKSNYPCEIVFHIAELPPLSGVFTIQPRSPLPPLQHSAVTLDGGTQRAFAGDSNPAGPEIEIDGSLCGECNGLEVRPGTTKVEGLLIRELTINGFSGDGILIASPDLSVTATAYVDGCYIGTDPTGTRAVPNGGSGIRFVNGSGLTGRWPAYLRTRPTEPNLISGNGRDGITSELGGYFASHFSLIGTDISGLYPIPNGENGVRTGAGSELRGNTIAFNRDRGVLITKPDHQNAVVRNQIHSNGALGVDLFGDGVTENGTPGIQNAPEILSARAEENATRVVVQLESPPLKGCCAAYLVSIHSGSFTDALGRGEGKTVETSRFLEGGEGPIEVVIRRNLAGKFLSATAVKFERFALYPLGTSSEFSKAMQVTTDDCPRTAPALLDAVGTDSVTFSWSAVPGVKTYILWSMKPGDMPRRLFEGTATLATVQLEPTRYEWWVEARFENCYGTQSEHRFVTGERASRPQ